MKTLRQFQLEKEHKYGKTAKTFFLDDVEQGEFESLAIAQAVYSMLLTQQGDVLIQNAISYLLRGLNVPASLESIQQALAILESPAFAELAEVHCIEGGHAFIRSKISLSRSAKDRLNDAMYLPPMVVPPLEWTDYSSGGYLQDRLPAVLGWKNRNAGHVNYAALNAAQETQFTLDGFILTRFKDSVVPADRELYEEIATYAMLLGRPFHFVWQYDTRGRMYSHGHHVNIQSREYKRNLINLAKALPLNQEGEHELLYALGQAAGCRRPVYEDQLAEGLRFYNMFCVQYEEDGSVDLTEEFFVVNGIEERISFTKYLLALLEHFVDGVECNVMVSRDATASGLQIMAALTGCTTSSRLTNLTSDVRECAYTEVINVINDKLPESSKIDRAVGKECLMTHYYCSIATPKKLLSPEQLDMFYEHISQMFEGPERVMRAIVETWNNQDTFTWTLPDGHTARVTTSVVKAADIEWHGAKFSYEYSEHESNNNFRHLPAK